jgi:orotate phosphoribosyltransferase
MKPWQAALGTTLLMQAVASFMNQALPVVAPLLSASTGLRDTLMENARVFRERMTAAGFEIKPGERLLLVEDVITTGGTLLELTDFIESQGGIVAGVFVVVNRSGKTTVGDYPVVSGMEIQFPVYEPDAVPESLAAIPAVRPGTKKVG